MSEVAGRQGASAARQYEDVLAARTLNKGSQCLSWFTLRGALRGIAHGYLFLFACAYAFVIFAFAVVMAVSEMLWLFLTGRGREVYGYAR